MTRSECYLLRMFLRGSGLFIFMLSVSLRFVFTQDPDSNPDAWVSVSAYQSVPGLCLHNKRPPAVYHVYCVEPPKYSLSTRMAHTTQCEIGHEHTKEMNSSIIIETILYTL